MGHGVAKQPKNCTVKLLLFLGIFLAGRFCNFQMAVSLFVSCARRHEFS